ncbi:MAG: hypothetical protein J6K55_15915 [Clostridia bacterium]|nr:hypothetical protein [Clostridia bacterium]
MKKILASVLAALLVLTMMVPVLAEGITMGQVVFAAHGTKCFAVITVAMDGDKIAAALIEEFQPMDPATCTVVPNAEAIFGAQEKLLASKRLNSESYSANMSKAGSTVALIDNYAALEAFAAGKTIAELEAEVIGKEATAVVDAVAGCTLVDAQGYLTGIIEAAKAAK